MRRLMPAVVVALAASFGCTKAVAPVSGTVTLDGKPVEGASVTFLPMDADGYGVVGSATATDAQGRYVQKLVFGGRQPGVAVGKHKVSVSLFRADLKNPDGMMGREMLPDRYNTATELTYEVPKGGTDQANFDLKSK